jgi:hypothetical protein
VRKERVMDSVVRALRKFLARFRKTRETYYRTSRRKVK